MRISECRKELENLTKDIIEGMNYQTVSATDIFANVQAVHRICKMNVEHHQEYIVVYKGYKYSVLIFNMSGHTSTEVHEVHGDELCS